MITSRTKKNAVLLGGLFLGNVIIAGCGPKDTSTPKDLQLHQINGVTYLGQGWNNEERQQLSYTSFGSRLLNYDWFMALEQPETFQLFSNTAYLNTLGFISGEASEHNVDGLPLGITKDSDGSTTWVGLTCAACHTGQLTYQGRNIRIDGGQALINYDAFEQALLSSMKSTLQDSTKWSRFVARMQSRNTRVSEAETKVGMEKRVAELEKRYSINATNVPYGHGRLDAFGQIFNAVTVEALNIPENRRSPNAPTSFPVLWDASHLDVVQWNSSAPNKEPGPLGQNATTALAVYGTVDVLGQGKTYPSSIKIKDLGYIQAEFYKLRSPKWPESLFGSLDKNLVAQGAALYQKNCISCHSLVNDKDFNRRLEAVSVPAAEVGTDPLMVNNFSQGSVKTGELQGKKSLVFAGDTFGATASRLDVVMHVTTGALFEHPLETLSAVLAEYTSHKKPVLDDKVNYYKARPLNGAWASAPYLHNGSVPSIYDLLLPPAQRTKQFVVGDRELDTKRVGNVFEVGVAKSEHTSLYDTQLEGNSNQGHLYGTQLSDVERWALVEYIKSL